MMDAVRLFVFWTFIVLLMALPDIGRAGEEARVFSIVAYGAREGEKMTSSISLRSDIRIDKEQESGDYA